MLLTVGPYAVQVEVDDGLDDCGNSGISNTDGPFIKMHDLNPTVHTAETLLHEVVHLIDIFVGAGMSERQVQGVAHYLTHVLRSNPELVAFIQEAV